jgi:hypothetical protein
MFAYSNHPEKENWVRLELEGKTEKLVQYNKRGRPVRAFPVGWEGPVF